MRAITFIDIESLSLENVADPAIVEAGDVIIEVDAAGICGSDLHPYLGRERGLDRGTIMGHELVGRIVAVGSDVRTFNIGDRVVAPFTTSCGKCWACELGLTSRCTHGQLFGCVENGLGLHGAQAEFVRVPLADCAVLEHTIARSMWRVQNFWAVDTVRATQFPKRRLRARVWDVGSGPAVA